MSSNFGLTNEQFNKISSLLPIKPRGVPRVDDRRVLSGIISAFNEVTAGPMCRRNMAQPRRSIAKRPDFDLVTLANFL